MDMQNIEDFQSSETTYTFVKSIEHTTPRKSPDVDYRLWVIEMYQYWFTECNKYTTVVWDARDGEVVGVGGQRVYGNSLNLLLDCAINLKLFQKKKKGKKASPLPHPPKKRQRKEKIGLSSIIIIFVWDCEH